MARSKKNKEIPENSAVPRVFNIVELTEKILLEVPFKNLMRCLRVSKHINTVIKGSLALQRKLHLAPEPATSENDKRLLPILPTLFTTTERAPSKQWCRRINTTLSDSCSAMLVAQPPVRTTACTIVFAECRAHDRYRRDHLHFDVENVNGITLGDISNAARKEVLDEGAYTGRDCAGCKTGDNAYKIVLHPYGSMAAPVQQRQEERRKKPRRRYIYTPV